MNEAENLPGMSNKAHLYCTGCCRPYPDNGALFRCPTCGGIYDFAGFFPFDPEQVDPDQPGIWRYQHALGLPAGTPIITLGEGNTPLEWWQVSGQPLGFKLEHHNPTGSFKDRGTAALVSYLKSIGVTELIAESAGNSGISLASYAAKAGIRASLLLPDSVVTSKRWKIAASGAHVQSLPVSLSMVAEAAQQAGSGIDRGWFQTRPYYAGHACAPWVLPGYATLAYELVEQLGRAPGSVTLPVGHGNLLLGLGRGFQALQAAGVIDTLPLLVGVQALACAPLWALYEYGGAGMALSAEGETIADELRVRFPPRGDAVLQMIREMGVLVPVEEEDIPPAQKALAALGYDVEPSAAVVWSAIAQADEPLPQPAVVIITGSNSS